MNSSEKTTREKLEGMDYKSSYKRNIIYGVLLFLVFPFVLWMMLETWNIYFIIFTIMCPALGIVFLYMGINEYKL